MPTDLFIIIILNLILGLSVTISAQQETQKLPAANAPGHSGGSVDYGHLFERIDQSVGTNKQIEILKGFAAHLGKNPQFKAYVISYGSDKSSADEVRSRAEKIKLRIIRRGRIDASRVEIIQWSGCKKWKVELWVWVREAPVQPSAGPCDDAR